MKVVIEDGWSEMDFVKFIEANINYKFKHLESTYWAEGDDTNQLSKQDQKNKATWDALKLICVSEDGGGNTLYYSKSKHGFYFISHEYTLVENLRNFVKWKDAIEGFTTFNLKYLAGFSYLKRLIEFYKLENKCSLVTVGDGEIAFSLKTREEFNIDDIITLVIAKFNKVFYNSYRINKSVDDDKIYYDFYFVD